MLNYGIVGCGPVFEVFQVKSLLQIKEIKLAALSDLNEDRLKEAQRKYKVEKAYQDYHQLLKDKGIDVVLVNLPQHLHLRPCVEAAQAGKHIYVEKPIATTLEDARRIIDACRENKVKLCVGHQRRFINVEIKAKELIEQGYLGKVFKVRLIACWYEPRQNLLSKEWWYKRECGGGPLMRWGVHKADTLRYLLNQDAVRVYAEMDTFVHRQEEITVEDNLVALIRFNEGTIAELEVSNSQQEAGMRRGETVELWGDEGTLWYRPSTGEMELYSRRETNPINKDSFVRINLEPDGQEMVRIHRKFVKSIKENTIPPVTGEDGYKALEMVIASYMSAQGHKPVFLPIGE